MLVESGMSKKEANAFVKLVDEDANGLSKDELGEWYIEHPEDEDKVNMLWESMGWKTSFDKSKKNLDKQRVYRSNPLYAEMDEDESGSVTKSEMMDYAIEHEDQLDELAELYKEQGYKGTFRSALKSAEQTKLKEQAEDAFYDGDYNVLFDTVSQMKNGKSYLTTLIKDEYDEYDNVSNPLIRYMIDAKRPTKEIDEAVESYGTKKLIPQYKSLRSSGMTPSQAMKTLDVFDANGNGSITQAELADYYKSHKDDEKTIAEFWKACGWSTSWKTYKKRKKLK
jgi:Ca2+-binding EF-hand superfamily protein